MSLSKSKKNRIRDRTGNCCEYCLISQSARLVRFHVDHIIAKKHGGSDDEDNLCLACYECNGFKSENVAAHVPLTGDATKFYHPRQQTWDVHFKLNDDTTISGLTPEGRTTVAVLRINDPERIKQRFGKNKLVIILVYQRIIKLFIDLSPHFYDILEFNTRIYRITRQCQSHLKMKY